MAGLLDFFSQDAGQGQAMDPRLMGLLGMAGSLGQTFAAQPASRLPQARPNALQTIGSLAGGFGQGYGQGLYQQHMNAATDAQKLQNQFYPQKASADLYGQNLNNMSSALMWNMKAPYLGQPQVPMPGVSTQPVQTPSSGPSPTVGVAPSQSGAPLGPQTQPTLQGNPQGAAPTAPKSMADLYKLEPPMLKMMGFDVPPELMTLWLAGYKPGMPEYDNLAQQFAMKQAGVKGITEPSADSPSQILDPRTMRYGVMPGQLETMGNAAYVKVYGAELPKMQANVAESFAKPRDVAPGAQVVVPGGSQAQMPAFRLPFGGGGAAASLPQSAGAKSDAMQPLFTNQNSPALVNMNTNAEPEFQKQQADILGKEAGALFTTQTTAQNQLQTLGRARQLIDQWKAAGGQQGMAAPLQAQASAFVKATGLDPMKLNLPSTAGPAEALDAISKELALGKIGPGGLPANNFSEADRKFVQGIPGDISNTPEGWEAKIAMAERVAQRNDEKANQWLNWPDQSQAGYRDFKREWSKYIDSHPLFTADEQSKMVETLRGATTAKPFTDADVEYTARMNGVSVEEVRKRLDQSNVPR